MVVYFIFIFFIYFLLLFPVFFITRPLFHFIVVICYCCCLGFGLASASMSCLCVHMSQVAAATVVMTDAHCKLLWDTSGVKSRSDGQHTRCAKRFMH